jgi:hypothetical protein|tara:strand:- start:2439 stop:2558 length:120 start_codon:yes stop_codon:yes gene_type:complete
MAFFEGKQAPHNRHDEGVAPDAIARDGVNEKVSQGNIFR